MQTLKEIREKYQATYQSKMFYKKPYNDMATVIVKLLLYTKITANQVTVFWVILGILSTLLFVFGNYWITILGFLLFHFHIVLDSVDGPISRIRNIMSSKGIYIERIGHDLVYVMFFFCVALGAHRRGFFPNTILIFGFTSSFGYFFYKHTRRAKIFTVLLHEYKSKVKSGVQIENQKKHIKKLKKKNILGINLDSLKKFYLKTQIIWEPIPCFIISTVLALFDLVHYIPIFYGITYPIQFLISYVYQAKVGEKWVYDWLENYWIHN